VTEAKQDLADQEHKSPIGMSLCVPAFYAQLQHLAALCPVFPASYPVLRLLVPPALLQDARMVYDDAKAAEILQLCGVRLFVEVP
jgi:hypothetical protein